MAKRSEIIERQQRLAELRRQREVTTRRQAAAALNVSLRTAHKDWLAVDALFREQAAADVAAEKGRDLALLDELIAAAMDGALEGKVASIRVINELLARRAAIYGYDAPTKSQVSGEIDHYHHDELDADARRVVEEAERVLLGQDRPAECPGV